MSVNHLWVYGIIGDKPLGSNEKYYSFENFRTEFDPEASEYVVHIISPGGDVYQGLAIYNTLKNTGKTVKTFIEGLCASIATLIAGASSPGEMRMNKAAQFMIHNPKFTSISGDANDLRNAAVQLDQIKSLLINVYQERTGLPKEKLWQMYDSETYMMADEAKSLGFVDEVSETLKAVAFIDHKYLQMEDITTKKLSLLDNLIGKVQALLSPKNQVVNQKEDTLADGTKVIVLTEDEVYEGKQITYEDGSPLPPGEYPLESGAVLTVGENSTISTKKEAEAKTEETPDNDMKIKEENETLKARVAELESALQAQSTNVTKAEARAKTAESKLAVEMKALQDELNKIKTTTVGDQAPPKNGTEKTFGQNQNQAVDPLQAWYNEKIFKVRNTD